jgi:hypothetical protein
VVVAGDPDELIAKAVRDVLARGEGE